MTVEGFQDLAAVYDHAKSGGDFEGVTAWTIDPLSQVLLLIFMDHRRGVRRVRCSQTLNDATVRFARLDRDARGNSLQLEIHPLKSFRCPVEEIVS